MTKTPVSLSYHTALIDLMVMVSAADGAMPDPEFRAIGQIVQGLPAFATFDAEKLVSTAKACARLLQKESADTVLDRVVAALPITLYETAYTLACEVAVADRKLAPEELRFLDIVRRKLHLSRLVAVALERGAAARYQIA
ncbi:MAG: hypothetical protein FJX47_15045 [Alphaproteobacteria bacterium]|nr:hypothetical protein [Alphaproteobacteria bacterium]